MNQFNQFICKNKQTHHHYLFAKQMYFYGQTHQVICKQNMSGLTSLLFHHSASDQSTKMHQAKKTKRTQNNKKNQKNENTEKNESDREMSGDPTFYLRHRFFRCFLFFSVFSVYGCFGHIFEKTLSITGPWYSLFP